MSGVLLDTHILIWTLFDRPDLSRYAQELIDAADDVFVSVVSIYEIDFKRSRGGVRAADTYLNRMPANLPAYIPTIGFHLLDIDAEMAWQAARLPIEHGDPWDRILVAQALLRDIPLISADRRLRQATNASPLTRSILAF